MSLGAVHVRGVPFAHSPRQAFGGKIVLRSRLCSVTAAILAITLSSSSSTAQIHYDTCYVNGTSCFTGRDGQYEIWVAT